MFDQSLEWEAIKIIRQAYSGNQKVGVLFSGGKDSIVLSYLVRKALLPANIEITLIHIDTGYNFPEIEAHNILWAQHLNANLIIHKVTDTIKLHQLNDPEMNGASRNAIQGLTLTDAIQFHDFKMVLGGARRDEERARSKEKYFSIRALDGKWNSTAQQQEFEFIPMLKLEKDQHFRVFPLSNWSENQIWNFIEKEQLSLPNLYFSHVRKCILINDFIFDYHPSHPLLQQAVVKDLSIRFRTIGDVFCSTAVISKAATVKEVIDEHITATTSERGTRYDDSLSKYAMEERKKNGYF
ncbi:MAG: hypothetical protein RIQ89_14 [Bacteroidota bacterium]